MCHAEGHTGSMPHSNTGTQTLLGLVGQLLSVLATDDFFVAFALGHPDYIDHLVIPEHLAHRELLPQPLLGPVQDLGHSAPDLYE